jgi:PAS domain S-box-containing protein
MLKDFNFSDAVIDWLNDYAPRGIVITDAKLVVRGWNRWLEYCTGRSAEAVLGSRLFDVFPELTERGFDQFYRNALDGQNTVLAHRFHRYLVKVPAPEHGLTEMQQTAIIAPLVSQDAIVGTITSIEDVSQRVLREAELLAAREEADKANRSKDKFLAVLSHDLRTPLTAMVGWTRILSMNPNNEKLVRKGVEIIERNAAVQLQLIEQVLDISRISAAKLELDLAPVEVRDIVNSALETLEPIAQAKDIRFERMMPQDSRTAILDGKRFQQIVWNLVSNSLKFTAPGGLVSASLRYLDSHFQLSITDTGKGIEAEALPHIFDPLWQADNSSGHGGLGLGLAIVKNLVELHGGRIHAESAGSGQGATFTLDMPWSRPEPTRVNQHGA